MTIVKVDSYLPPVGRNFFTVHWTRAGSDAQAEHILTENGVPADATVYRTKDGTYWYPLSGEATK